MAIIKFFVGPKEVNFSIGRDELSSVPSLRALEEQEALVSRGGFGSYESCMDVMVEVFDQEEEETLDMMPLALFLWKVANRNQPYYNLAVEQVLLRYSSENVLYDAPAPYTPSLL